LNLLSKKIVIPEINNFTEISNEISFVLFQKSSDNLTYLAACVGNTSFILVEEAILKNKRFHFGELGREARFEEVIQVPGATQ
jgi:hypothetical protein